MDSYEKSDFGFWCGVFLSPRTCYNKDDLIAFQSHLRNKLVAEAFYLAKNIEKYGSGFIRIRKELEIYPEASFDVEEVGDGFMLTFRLIEGVSEGVSYE